MSKGKRGIGLNKPCPKCGSEVPAMYRSPVKEGLCGKCSDRLLRERAGTLPRPTATKRLVLVVPGGRNTVVGFAVGLGFGILTSVALALFVPTFWGNIIKGLGDLFGL
ncbi:MAG: hypothetical protein ACYTHM_08365 [Planctomycetota bacterium]|jgi:hypothetical protein